ncbi:hypothetical protein J7K42_01515 [bacterium]|nr:hypothetical protein [bacterium]
MLKFLKSFSLKKIFLKKQIVFIFLIFLSFSLLFPSPPAYAQFGVLDLLGTAGKGALWFAQALLGLFLQFILLIAQGVLAIGIALLSGVINFTLSGAVSLTSPDKNEIIRVGWTLVRDFVNIGFILGLIYIGLATALRIAGFELKKVFPWFLIMALLINFTPVICGVVVDAANIVMKFFLGAMANWSLLGEVFSSNISALGDLFTTLSWVPVAKFVFLIVFGFAAGFVLLVFAILLLLRAIIIPLLVILSPFAFLSYIFPYTKRLIWDRWWSQFLQWSFIGAIGGFFLYLSRLALREQAMFKFAIPAEDPALATFMEQIAPYYVGVAFLMVGLFATFSTSAMGANLVTGFAKKQGLKALKWGSKKLEQGTKAAAAGIGTAVAGATKGIKEGRGVKGRVGGAFKGAFTREGREKGREATEKWLERRHLVRPGFYEEKRRKRLKLDEEVKRLENLPTDRLYEIMKRRGITTKDVAAKIASFEILSKRRSLGGDITTPEGREKEELAKKMVPLAKTYGANLKEMLKARPDWAETPEKIKEQIEGMSPRQVRLNVQPQALRNIDVFIALDLSKIRDIATRGTEEQKRALVEAPFTREGRITRESFTWAEQHRVLTEAERSRIRRFRENLAETEKNPNLNRFFGAIPGSRRRIPGLITRRPR